ncbi:MAG: hypothetical protein C5B55_04110 [Blastocatellia bacterium]|nr:MAG: hypothetical protein C5B55_04110 [Blastocatellia bacterium]
MPSIRKILTLAAIVFAIYCGPSGAIRATPVAIGFPPPGVTVSPSGTSGSTAGRTFAYTVTLNPPTGYTDLYWTMEGVQGPLSSMSTGGTIQNLTFQGFQSGTGYVWTGNLWTIQTASGNQTFQTSSSLT